MSSVALNFVASRLNSKEPNYDADDADDELAPAKRRKLGRPSIASKEFVFLRDCARRSDAKYVALRSRILVAAQPFVSLLASLPEPFRNVPHNIVVLRSGASILVDDLNMLKRLVEDLRA